MTTHKNKLGRTGEDAAVAFLERRGYHVLRRNFRNKLGEIDVIAKDGDTICFIEVKTRTTDHFGSPFDSVTAAKQRKISHVAMSYLRLEGRSESKARFDVVAVLIAEDETPQVEIIKNAFETI